MDKLVIGVSEFAETRHTPGSNYSHYGGYWTFIKIHVERNWHKRKQVADGIVLVPVSPENYYASVVELRSDMEFETVFESRCPGEAPFRHSRVKGVGKSPAKFVDIVLYRKDVLERSGDDATGADWDIVSINARLDEREPQTPMAMARNFLGLKGGTTREYMAQEFAEAIIYWSKHVMVSGLPKSSPKYNKHQTLEQLKIAMGMVSAEQRVEWFAKFREDVFETFCEHCGHPHPEGRCCPCERDE